MADISMCFGTGCDKRANCYRFNASPGRYSQSYTEHNPENCQAYWPTFPRCGQRGYEEDRPCLVCGGKP